MRTLRERGETLFAIYHSHPAGPATPRPPTFAEAAYPQALYLIISLAADAPGWSTPFRFRGRPLRVGDPGDGTRRHPQPP